MTGSSPAPIFITGCYRSGTTLLEKLLHNHPEVCVASQPFPILFYHVKSAFNREIGITRRYPLDHLFLEDAYTQEDLHAFLDTHVFTSRDVDEIFDGLAGFHKGLWTPEILNYRNRIRPGTFLEIYEQLRLAILELFPKDGVRLLGSKEVLCEELIPYFLDHGIRVVLSIRDPRAVIASLNFGRHDDFTGAIRPTLYTIRSWRKSVAFALDNADHPNFAWVRFEDVAERHVDRVNDICERFALSRVSVETYAGGIKSQGGGEWRGNSSFGEIAGVSARPRSTYATVMPRAAIDYVEACCLPEMDALGYSLSQHARFDESVIRDYREPFPVDHPAFPSNYSESSEHADEEIARYRLLESGEADDATIRKWFLNDTAFRRLASAVRA